MHVCVRVSRRIVQAGAHLWGGVVGRAAGGLEEVAVAHDVGQPEVRDLDVHLAVQQQVLRLQVPARRNQQIAC